MHYTELNTDQLNNLYAEFSLSDIEQTQLTSALIASNQYKYKEYGKGGNKYHALTVTNLLNQENLSYYSPRRFAIDVCNVKYERIEGTCFQEMERCGLLNKSTGHIGFTTVGQIVFGMLFKHLAPEYLRKKIRKALNIENEEKVEKEITYSELKTVLSDQYIEAIEKYIDKQVGKRTKDLQLKVLDYEAVLSLISEAIDEYLI